MRRIRRVAVVPLLAAVIAPGSAGAATCAGADTAPAQLGRAQAAKTTLCLLNRERAAHGLRPLRLDARLARAAGGHARDMVAGHYFAHDSRSGASFDARIRRTGWMRSRRSWRVGENLGYGEGATAAPRRMVAAWMHSAGHRANILAPGFREIGIGIAAGSPTGAAGATYATDFGG